MSDFIIPIYVRDESELYTAFDPSGLSFSSDLTEYLSDYVEDRKLGEMICVEVRSEARPDMERMKKAFAAFTDKLSRRNRREIMRSRANSIRILIIGILFIVIGISSSNHVNSVIAAIVSTIGSFSVWEASAEWIETLPALRKKEKVLKLIADAEIRYIGSDKNE